MTLTEFTTANRDAPRVVRLYDGHNKLSDSHIGLALIGPYFSVTRTETMMRTIKRINREKAFQLITGFLIRIGGWIISRVLRSYPTPALVLRSSGCPQYVAYPYTYLIVHDVLEMESFNNVKQWLSDVMEMESFNVSTMV
ncbi:hypothetical protein Sjap_013653 [Stephania japonica]|uniref:Uncharacterized protein n=1 Tax=Stephania japonica TaxID=461633 RepID=A0AAP0J0U7_9MAGN